MKINGTIFHLSILFLIPFLNGFGRMTYRYHQKEHGALYIGLEVPFYGLDVLGSAGLLTPEMTIINTLMLKRRFAMGPSGKIFPVLGMSTNAINNGNAWEIELRQGVQFHDGTPFDADAVAHY